MFHFIHEYQTTALTFKFTLTLNKNIDWVEKAKLVKER